MTLLSSRSSPSSVNFYHNMTFPLNVYAHVLQLEEGKTEYLHYGLFKTLETSLTEAQGYSTELILAELPSAPCRLLDVGIGLGTTLKLLTEKGYQSYGISPDAHQINYVQKNWDHHAPIRQDKLEDFEIPSNSFEVILLQESAQYINPSVIFNKALEGLTATGSLIILDEFLLNSTPSNSGHLHPLDEFLDLAERVGFQCVKHQDLSTLAAPTLDYLLKVIDKHRESLLSTLALSTTELDSLNKSNRAYKKYYSQGIYGYALLHFKKKSPSKWQIKPFDPINFSALHSLFNASFNECLAFDFWQWKYQPYIQAMCAWDKNTMIAHYGGVPRSILYFSKPDIALQITDVMVHPTQRAVFTKKGAFFLTASAFLEHYIGYDKPYLLGFGFPNERAMKIAEYLGLYAEVGKMGELSWAITSTMPLLSSHLRVINTDNQHQFLKIVDSLWQAMQADLSQSIIGVRDFAYLNHRYLNHPQRVYHIFVVKNRLSHQYKGLVVLDINDQRSDLVDIIAPFKNIPLLVQHARRIATLHHCHHLYCQITDSFATYFKTPDADYQLMEIRIPSNQWTSSPSATSLKNRWWLMAGDMDFR